MAAAPPIATGRDGDAVVVAIRLTPKSGRDALDGVAIESGPRGPVAVLKARVSAPPEDGKANAALIALLARAWGVPRSALSLISGATQRVKRVRVAGDPEDTMTRIARRLHGP